VSLTTVAHRITVYAGRHVDPTELTVLVGSGAVHADAFKIATTSKLAGWKGYLHDVTIKSGGIDYLERRTTVPQCSFTLRDQRITEGGSNLIRWWTGLMGAAGGNGRFQQSRCKFVVEESVDWDEETGTGTWAVVFTGRINLATVKGILVKVTGQGMTKELLDARIFTRRPHASVANAIEAKVIPLGLSGTFGTIPAAPILRGTVGNSSSGTGKSIKLDAASQKQLSNIITRAMREHDGVASVIPRGSYSSMRGYDGTMRVRIVAPGPTSGDLRLLGYKMFHREEGHFAVVEVAIEALAIGTEQYIALPADGTLVEVDVRSALSEPSKSAPLLLGEQHAAQYWMDLLDGKFGDLTTTGAVLRSWPRSAAKWAALLADQTVRSLQFIIEGPDKLMAWGQTQINKVAGFTIGEDELGQVEPIDLRIPTSLGGIVTLVDDDLLADEAPEWEHSADDAIQRFECVTGVDDTWAPQDLKELSGFFPDIPASLIESYEVTTFEPDFSAGGGGQILRLDAKGLRTTVAELSAASGAHKQDRILGEVVRLLDEYRIPFAAGPQRITAVCRRTTNVNATKPGMWRLVQFSKLPDPSTNLRGGVRLMLCLDKVVDKGKVTLKFLDIGPNVVCTVPVIGALGAGADAQHEVTIPVTVNAAGDPVKVEVAYTTTAVGVAPVDASPLWTAVATVKTSQTVTTRNGLPGKRCWVRIRSEPGPTARKAALVSPWVFAAPAFRDLTALATFASLVVSNVTSKAAKLTINLGGNTKDIVRILISSGASKVLADATTPVKLVDYPPGSTEIQLSGLEQAGPWYKVQAAPFDGIATVGTPVGIAATSFEATGTPIKWPKLAGVTPLGGTSIIPAVKAFDQRNQVTRTGNTFNLLPGQLGLDILVQRAADVAGVPGTPVDFDVIPTAQIPKEGKVWADEVPTGTPWWYRFAHRGDGGDDSDWSEWIKAMPGVIPPETLFMKSPGALPRDRTVAGQERTITWATSFLVPNGEFDTWITDTEPAGWSVDAAGTAARDRVVKMSGDAALKYTLNAAGWHGVTTDEETAGPFCMPLRAGRRYRLQVGFRVSSIGAAAPPEARLTLTFDVGALLTASRVFRLETAGVYKVYTWVVDVPAGAEANTRLAVEFNRQGVGGAVDFHVDSLRPDEDGAELGTVVVANLDTVSQLVPNWHFEQGYAFWRRYDNTYRSIFIDGLSPLRGALGVRMGTGVFQTGYDFGDVFIVACDRPTDEVTDEGELLYAPVEPGQELLLKVRSKVNNAGFANVEVGVLEHANPSGLGAVKVLITDDNTITTEQERTAVYTVPAGVNWVTPFLRILGGMTINLLWDVDDLQVWRFPRKERVKAYRSTALTLASGVATAVPLDADYWNPDGWHNNGLNPSRVTPQLGLGTAVTQGGVLLLHGQIAFDDSVTGVYRSARIRKNGTVYLGETRVEQAVAATPDTIVLQVTALDHAWTPGDYYELVATADAAIDVLAGADLTWLFATHLL
jgi:hypothetical protein